MCCCPADFIAGECNLPTSAFRCRCSSTWARRRFSIDRRCGRRAFRSRASRVTNMRAATRSWFRAALATPVRRGLPRVPHCAPAPASSRSRRRARRSPSMRRRASRSWCGRSMGPGGGVGEPMRALVAARLKGPRAVVLDADALTSFEDDAKALCAMLSGRDHPAVLTPHAGEFARLFKNDAEIVGKTSKIDMARAAAARTGTVVLLKGPDTVLAAPNGRAGVSDNAPPWLATAGAGDVLAGFIAGLLAQGMPGFEAAAAAAWVHGEAATHVGPGLIAEDLSEAVPSIYRRLFADIAGSYRVAPGDRPWM